MFIFKTYNVDYFLIKKKSLFINNFNVIIIYIYL